MKPVGVVTTLKRYRGIDYSGRVRTGNLETDQREAGEERGSVDSVAMPVGVAGESPSRVWPTDLGTSDRER